VSSPASQLPICVTIETSYALPLIVALHSLAGTNVGVVPDVVVHVAYERLAREARSRIARHAEALGIELRFAPVQLPAIKYQTNAGAARVSYLRLQIGELFASEPRVLYLDVDVVFVGNIRPLLEHDVHDFPVAAVRDPTIPCYRYGNAMPGWQDHGFEPDDEYFNAGVVLFNLRECAAQEVFDRAYHFIEKHPKSLRFADQDALNWAVAGHWLRLASGWNTFPLSVLFKTGWMHYNAESFYPVADLIADERHARILHYVSPAKPWHPGFPRGKATRLYKYWLARAEQAESRGFRRARTKATETDGLVSASSPWLPEF
jgi:lipopolysaccharide biosynthesis glycosyltransferase